MTRYETFIEDGTVYVEADVGNVEVGPVSDIIKKFGEEYEIEYDEWEKQRYDVSFADEGLRMDVKDTLESMTHDKRAVEWLAEKPLDLEEAYDNAEDSFFSTGRMALFCGFLAEALHNGPR